MSEKKIEQKTLEQMSASEIKDYLAEKQKEEKAAQQKLEKEYRNKRDNLLQVIADQFKKEHRYLSELKEQVIEESEKLYNEMYRLRGQEPKPVKGFALKNEAGNIRLDVEKQERLEFTEEAAVHIHTIKEIFYNKFASRNKGLYNLLDTLLVKSRDGEYDPKLLSKARRQVRELGDEKLIEQFDKLDECQRVYDTATYCRLYIKDDKGKFKDVSLQFSAL